MLCACYSLWPLDPRKKVLNMTSKRIETSTNKYEFFSLFFFSFFFYFLKIQVWEITFIATSYWKRTGQRDQREKARGRGVQEETNNTSPEALESL